MKNKTTAALLAFFLGGLGAHRFYLGEAGIGVLYLLFCWTLVPGLIALFDFVVYLRMSEDDFNRKYNANSGIERDHAITAEHNLAVESANTLHEINSLYQSGKITVEEYEEKRKKLLDSI